MNNGYIAIDFKGQRIGLKFGMTANELLITKLAAPKTRLLDPAGNLNNLGSAYLIYAGYVNNCIVKEQDEVLTLEDFVEWIEEVKDLEGMQEVFTNIANCYAESKHTKKLIDTINHATEAEKKKKIR